MIRLVDGAGGHSPRAPARLDEGWRSPSLLQLDRDLFTLLPGGGAAPVEAARRVARRLLARDAERAAIVFPGWLEERADRLEPVLEEIRVDLDERPPRLDGGTVALTSRCAAWLEGAHRVEPLTVYRGSSGRRVPLSRVVDSLAVAPAAAGLRPWRSSDILGRRVEIDRPSLSESLREALSVASTNGSSTSGTSHRAMTGLVVDGGLGVGKTRAVWSALDGAPRLFVDVQQLEPFGSSVDAETLADAVVRRIEAWLGGSATPDGALDGAGDPVSRVVDRLRRAPAEAPPWLVVEGAESLDADALALLAALSAGDVPCGVVISGRPGGLAAFDRALGGSLASLPRCPVPPMAGDQSVALAGALADGMELPAALVDRLVAGAAGRPFVLEETVLHLVQRGLVRQIYGSFFFAAEADVELEPSWRLCHQLENELRRLAGPAPGAALEPLPLRVLAAADEPIDPGHLAHACTLFEVGLRPGWEEPWLRSGWLERVESGVALACPMVGTALRHMLSADGVRSLRHALGGVLAHGDRQVGWQAYRLLAGTPEAVPSLIEHGRDVAASDAGSREEVFNALWDEVRRHRSRYGDEASELELLWMLLPLARRLGCLGRLESELRRAVQLARGHDERYVALVALAAELDQEKGRFREAERGLREALRLSAGGDSKRRATLFVRLGALLHREERWREARTIFRSLLDVAEPDGPTPIGAVCRFYLGNIALQERRLDDAERLHAEALAIRRRLGLAREAGISLCATGAVSLAVGDYPKALNRYREAEEVLEQAGVGPAEWSFATLGVGRALGRLGDLMGAARSLRRVLEVREGKDDLVASAIARLELAENQLERGAVDRAVEQARRACFALQLAPEIALLGDAERVLARALMQSGAHDEARERIDEALRIHGRHEDRQAIAEDRGVLLELSLLADDLPTADRQALELEHLLEGLSHPASAERLWHQLFRAHRRLARSSRRSDRPEVGRDERDAIPFLRRAYQELLRKTAFLDAELRHPFLFQVEVNRAIVEDAAANHLSMPDLPLPPRP